MKHLLPSRLRSVLKRVRGRLSMFVNRHRSRPEASPVIVLCPGGASGDPAELVARASLARGHRVHLFARRFPEHEARYGHHWHAVDCLHGDGDHALAIAREIGPVAVLVENTNGMLPLQAYLADRLGLRSVGAAAARTSTRKDSLRDALAAVGTPLTPHMLLADWAPGALALPIVFKPITGSGSKGVRLLAAEEEVRAAIDELGTLSDDPTVGQDVMLEEYVAGRQFDVEGIARDGTFHLLSLVEQCFVDHLPRLVPSWYLFNPPLPAQLARTVEAAAVDFARAAGVVNGAWHVELRVDAAGVPRAVDFANRIGWNTLLEPACGVSFAEVYVAAMIDDDFRPPRPRPRCLLRRYLIEPMSVAAARALAADRPDAVVELRTTPGRLAGHWDYAGRLTVVADDFGALRALLRAHDLEPARWDDLYPESADAAATPHN